MNKKVKKILKICGFSILGIVLVLIVTVICVWHNEISTVASIKKIASGDDSHGDGSVYEMTYSGGYYFDEYLEQGGASSDSELIDFITNHITKGLIDVSISESEIACSSFTGSLEDGSRIFGRNYDFSRTNTCIVKTDPGDGRHASISTADLQFVGIDKDGEISGLMDKIKCLAAVYTPLDGINDAGVACGIYMTYQGEPTIPTDQNTDKPDLTSTTMLRMVLDYADDVDEAVELISNYDLHDSASTSYHYMIADSTGKSAILEWINETDSEDNDGSLRKLVVTYNDNDTAMNTDKYQCVTNFIVSPGYYDSDDEKAGLDRYEHIYSQLTNTDGVFSDEADAMQILAQVGRRTWNNDDNNSITVHSVIYNLTEKTALWVGNEHYGDSAYTFEYNLNK